MDNDWQTAMLHEYDRGATYVRLRLHAMRHRSDGLARVVAAVCQETKRGDVSKATAMGANDALLMIATS